jgi:hypothetical protein
MTLCAGKCNEPMIKLTQRGRNCLNILLRITVVKIIAGSESNKHYLLETLLSFSNENLKKNKIKWNGFSFKP